MKERKPSCVDYFLCSYDFLDYGVKPTVFLTVRDKAAQFDPRLSAESESGSDKRRVKL